MAKRKKPIGGRPVGAESLVLNEPQIPFVYMKPCVKRHKWRVERVARVGGERKWFTLPQAEDLASAIEDRRKLAEEHRQATLPPTERPTGDITLGAAWGKFLSWKENYRGIRSSTLKSYKYDGGTVLGHFGEDKPIGVLTREAIIEFIGKRGSSRTKEKFQTLIKCFTRWAHSEGFLHDDPAAGLDIPTTWRRDITASIDEAPTVLDVTDIRALLLAAKMPYASKVKINGEKIERECHPPEDLHLALAIMALTGLRKGNVVGASALRWEDLDLTIGAESLRIDKDRMKGRRELIVPIAPQLAQLLRTHRASIHRWKPDDMIVGERKIDEAFKGALRRSGLLKKHANVRIHDIRHSFGALIEEAPEGVFRMLMAHSKAGHASRRYRHPTFRRAAEILAGIPDLLGGGAQKTMVKNPKKSLKIQANSG